MTLVLCGQVKLKQFFEKQFGALDVASVVYWGGLYKIHCHMVKVGLRLPAFVVLWSS